MKNSNDILNDNNLLQLLNENKNNKKTGVSGFIKYDGDIFMISESPILKNTSEGSSQGVVILGKRVSALFVEQLRKEFDVDIFINYNNKFISGKDISKEINENRVIINKNINNKAYKLNSSENIGSLPIVDITGNNIGYINVM